MWVEVLRRINECRSRQPVPALHNNIFMRVVQNRNRLSSVSSGNFKSQEIVMASIRTSATAAILASLLGTSAAFASQGPGGGLGTASPFTQLAMAIIVYGVSAVVVGAGLIGAARQRMH
jgi:hypothetical protein